MSCSLICLCYKKVFHKAIFFTDCEYIHPYLKTININNNNFTCVFKKKQKQRVTSIRWSYLNFYFFILIALFQKMFSVFQQLLDHMVDTRYSCNCRWYRVSLLYFWTQVILSAYILFSSHSFHLEALKCLTKTSSHWTRTVTVGVSASFATRKGGEQFDKVLLSFVHRHA